MRIWHLKGGRRRGGAPSRKEHCIINTRLFALMGETKAIVALTEVTVYPDTIWWEREPNGEGNKRKRKRVRERERERERKEGRKNERKDRGRRGERSKDRIEREKKNRKIKTDHILQGTFCRELDITQGPPSGDRRQVRATLCSVSTFLPHSSVPTAHRTAAGKIPLSFWCFSTVWILCYVLRTMCSDLLALMSLCELLC